MIRKLKTGEFRINPRTGRHRNLGTFKTMDDARKHERQIQYFRARG
jgi:hypothetical protein